MNRMARRMMSVLLMLLLLAGAGTAALAEEAEAPAAAGERGEFRAAENGSSIIDEAQLQQWMDGFAQENNLKQDYKRFSVGFWYSGTGDSWYYDADQWMYSASLYKVPVSMLMAEKEAAGELTLQTVVNGTTLEYLESTALVYSNNDSGHSMVSWLGGTYAGKCSDMTIRYTDLPESYFVSDFYDVSYYTARYMTQVMSTLYQGGEEKFPHVLDYLKQAQPNDYYNRDSVLKANYTIAQKFGAYEEPNGNNNNHCTAVIYTPNPIVVTVMTRNVGDYQNIIAAVGGHMAELALQLDQKLEEYRQAEAERKAAAVQEAQAEQTAAEARSIEMPVPEIANAAPMNAVLTEQNAESVETPDSGPAASAQRPAEGEKSLRKIPSAVIVIAAILAAVVIGASILLAIAKKRAAEDEQDPDNAESDAEELSAEEDSDEEDRIEDTDRSRHAREKRTDNHKGQPNRRTGTNHRERAERSAASPVKANRRPGSDGEYRPKH